MLIWIQCDHSVTSLPHIERLINVMYGSARLHLQLINNSGNNMIEIRCGAVARDSINKVYNL